MTLPEGHSRIVIIGGGAGGLELAIRLARKLRAHRRADVILIDRRASHVWRPRLHEIPLQGMRQTKDGRLSGDETLHVIADDGRPCEGLYGMGDCASVSPRAGKNVPSTAQAAHQQAEHLSRSIDRRLRGRKELPFRYRDKGTLVSPGGARAVGDVETPLKRSGVRITGVATKTVYAGLYAAHFRKLFGLRRAMALRLSQLFRRSAQPSVKLYW